MAALMREVLIATRQWRRHPGVPVAVVLTLGLAIAAVTATFAVAWAVLWRPLPAPQPDRLVWVEAQGKDDGGQSSPGAFSAWSAGARQFESIAAIRPVSGVLADEFGTDRLRGALVSDALISMLSVQPIAGRSFTVDEHAPGASRAVMISHSLWQTRYAGSRDVVGRSVTFNGGAAIIAGVLPQSAASLVAGAEFWSPMLLTAKDRANTGPRYLDVIGRLAPGASVASARDELRAISAELQLKQDDGAPLGVAITPLAAHLTSGYAASLQLLLAGVLALVLIAATNISVLLLTRWQERAPEFAVRASIGASRGQLLRQLLIEAGSLTVASVAAGVVFSMWITDLLRAILPAGIPRLAEARIDLPSIGFATLVGAAIMLLVGLLPALRGSAANLQSTLRESATGGKGHDGLRRAFVALQVAAAVVLTVAAVLLSQSARALAEAPRGYDASNVLTTSITLPFSSYQDGSAIASVVDRVLTDIALIPGAVAVTASSQLPFAGGSAGADLALQDEAFTEGVDRQVRVRLVAPDYLTTLGGRMREGREISATDRAGTLPVVVVNRALARRLTPDGSPVGRTVKFNVPVFNGADGQRVWTVVGVSDDTWDKGPREAVEPEVMIALAQTPSEVFFWISRELHLAVRSTGDPLALSGAVRRVVTRIDPGIPMSAGRTLDDRIAEAFARERLVAMLLVVLGLAGLSLALLGLGAVIDQLVRSQRREIAIRMALGASHRGVIRTFVGRGTAMAAIGVVAGVLLSLGLEPLLSSLLFGVGARDPQALGAVIVGVAAVSIMAAWIPARRAARVDPVEALRS